MPSGPVPSPSAIEIRARLGGLEYFQKMLAGEVPPPPFVSLLGLRLVEVEQGRVVFTGEADERYYNGLGVAHGGWAASLIDTALGCAINTTQPAGRSFTTLDLHVSLTRPLRRESGVVRCEARVVHVGKRVATAEAHVTDGAGKVYAHGTTTCVVVPLET